MPFLLLGGLWKVLVGLAIPIAVFGWMQYSAASREAHASVQAALERVTEVNARNRVVAERTKRQLAETQKILDDAEASREVAEQELVAYKQELDNWMSREQSSHSSDGPVVCPAGCVLPDFRGTK